MYNNPNTRSGSLERHKYFDQEEIDNIHRYIDQHSQSEKPTDLRDSAFIMLMLYAGLRCAEACQALKRNLHHPSQQLMELTVRTIKQKKKTDKWRTIPLTHAEAITVIGQQARESQAETILSTIHGKPTNTRSMIGRWEYHIRKKLDLKHNQGTHAFRHTYALRYYRTTKDIHGLAQLLGHVSIEATTIYIHATGKELAERTRQVTEANANQAQQQTVNIHIPQQLTPLATQPAHATEAQHLEAPIQLLGQIERWLMDNAEQSNHPTWQETLKLLRSMQNR